MYKNSYNLKDETPSFYTFKRFAILEKKLSRKDDFQFCFSTMIETGYTEHLGFFLVDHKGEIQIYSLRYILFQINHYFLTKDDDLPPPLTNHG